MSQLRIGESATSDVPGASEAQAQQESQRAAAEGGVGSLFKERDAKDAFGPDYSYQRIRIHKKDEVNPYAAEQDARYGLDGRAKVAIALGVALVIVYLLACILPTNVFSAERADRTLGTLAAETATAFQGLIGFFANPDTMYGTYVLTVLVTLLAGAAMGLSGGVFQGALKNALASPSTLGVTSGGSIGAIIYAVFLMPSESSYGFVGTYDELVTMQSQLSPVQQIVEEFGSFIASMCGCFLIVALIMVIAFIAGRGKVSNVSLVIAGQVFAAVIAVVLNWIRLYLTNHGDPEAALYLAQAQTMTFMGAYTPLTVLVFAIPLLVCMACIFVLSKRLSLLAFNDDEARSMGISPVRLRNVMVALCTVMTALVVSFCGPVGFVGFLVPHMARKMVGPDFRYLLPVCALLGALMVTAIFYVAQLGIPYVSAGGTGVLTSLVGCIAFIIIALRGRRSAGGEWL